MNISNSMLCDVNNSTLLIVDIQTALSGSMPGKVMDRIIDNTTLLLRSAELLGVPVIASEQYPRGLGEYIPEIQAYIPEDSLRFQKTCFSCCDNEDFMSTLKNSGRTQLILAGMEAHVCVLQTAVELKENGFDVFIAADAVSSRRLDNYQNALERLEHVGAVMVSSESVVFEWLRDAKHEKFKEIAHLLR